MSELGMFILDGKRNPVPAKSTIEWAEWFRCNDKRIAYTEIGNVRVSTVFLGIDHGWFEGPPILFETMIFGGEHDGEQRRYETWGEALKGHDDAVLIVRASPLRWHFIQMFKNFLKFCRLFWWSLRR